MVMDYFCNAFVYNQNQKIMYINTHSLRAEKFWNITAWHRKHKPCTLFFRTSPWSWENEGTQIKIPDEVRAQFDFLRLSKRKRSVTSEMLFATAQDTFWRDLTYTKTFGPKFYLSHFIIMLWYEYLRKIRDKSCK